MEFTKFTGAKTDANPNDNIFQFPLFPGKAVAITAAPAEQRNKGEGNIRKKQQD